MALTPEDGTGVADANSYVDLTELRAYALARGVTLPVDDTAAEILAIKAMDYLEAQRSRYQGDKVASTQSLQFPRTGLVIDGFDFAEDEIPIEIANAQCALAMELFAGVDLMPTQSGKFLIRDKTGPLESEWSETLSRVQPQLSKIDALLQPLFKSQAFGLRTFRA